MVAAKVFVNLVGLGRFKRSIADPTNPHILKAFKQWAVRYRASMQERFARLSRGSGEWPRLKHKRKRGAKEAAAVLRDTGLLFAALAPVFANNPGQFEQVKGFGVLVGYGGPGSYPEGQATVYDIAHFHQTGAGFLPVRRIIVSPDEKVVSGMQSDMRAAINILKN